MTDFLIAECGIRQLHARFVDAVARKDAEDFGACFAEDGEWKIATMHMRGRAEVQAAFGRLLGACARVQIIASPPILEVDGDTAIGRLYVTEITKMLDGSSAMTIGGYFDRYVEEGGRWRFRWRHFALHYRGPIDFSETLVEGPDYGRFPNMPGDDEPTITRRKIE